MQVPLHWIQTYGYLGVFSSLMLGVFGLPVPDETILTFTGFLISKHYLHPVPGVLAALLGSICGVSLSYLVGRTVGFPMLLRYGHHIHITGEKMENVLRWFEKSGKWSLFVAYFLPGVRHLTALTAGASSLRFRVFAPFAFSGGLIWVMSFIGLGWFLGKKGTALTQEIHQYLWLTLGALIFLSLVLYLVYRIRRPDRSN